MLRTHKKLIVTIIVCCLVTFSFFLAVFAQTSGEAPKEKAEWFDWWVKGLMPLIHYLLWPGILIWVIITFEKPLRSLIKKTEQIKVELPGGGKLEISAPDDPQKTQELIDKVTHISAMNAQDSLKQAEQAGKKAAIKGDPDQWQLFCKYSVDDGTQKSTKVMNLPNGCLVQLTTREIGRNGQVSAAEAVTFVPDLNVKIAKDKDGNIAQAEFVKIDLKS